MSSQLQVRMDSCEVFSRWTWGYLAGPGKQDINFGFSVLE
jgi:hypothetical protein